MHKLGFVGRRHHYHARQDSEEGDVERACVGRAIGADETCPSMAKRTGISESPRLNDLIIAALEESRINSAEGLVTFGREAGREGDRMLFRDPHVESALWEALLEISRPCRSA